MNSAIVISIVINFVISFSMKKLLETIRVYQLTAFFVLLFINFPPITKDVLLAIYSFATFKVVPKQAIRDVLDLFGLDSSTLLIRDREEAEKRRRLFEASDALNFSLGGTRANSLIEDLNAIVVAIVGVICLGLLFCLLLICRSRCPSVSEKLQKKVKTKFFNVVHQMFNNAALPMLVTSLTKIKHAIEAEKADSAVASEIFIICIFCIYPLATFRYLNLKGKKLDASTFIEFNSLHKHAYINLRLWQALSLSFILVAHFRRILFATVIVLLSQFPWLQIHLILFLSIILMCFILSERPLASRWLNRHECLTEVVVLVSCYHLLLITDFVPMI